MPYFHPDCTVKIDGAEIAQDMKDNLLEVVVDDSLYLPGMFVIRIKDDWTSTGFKYANDTAIDLGKTVEITTKTEDSGGTTQTAVIMSGEITSLEPVMAAQATPVLLIRGYSKAHRLHRGKKTRTFLNQKDDQIVGTIAGEAGLSADADATTVTYPFVIQNNQTNMEFLQARAARLGYHVYVAEGKLCFKKAETSAGSGPTLNFGKELLRFQPRMAGTHQAQTVTVKSWDPKGKAALSGTASSNAALRQGGMTNDGGAAAASAFADGPEAVIADQPCLTADECTALATGLRHDMDATFLQAEGEAMGDPRIKPGWKITIAGVGSRFDGAYTVTAATHTWNNKTGYHVHFSSSGRQPETMRRLLGVDAADAGSRGLMRGVVTGLVTNLADPDNLGRVKVKYAWLGEIESDWARIATPWGGSSRGFFWLPEVNDEVLIAFEHGDPHRPYVLGGLWNSVDKPPETNANAQADGKVNKRIIKTRAGHLITLDDSQGKEQVKITTKSGHEVLLDDTSGSEKISVIDKTKNNKMVIDSAANTLTVNTAGDMTFDSKGKITLKAATGVDMQSQATFKITGQTGVEVASQTTLKMSSQTSTELASSLATTVKGTTVAVQGSAMTEVKGGLVKIN